MTERNAEPELVSLAILDVCERAARAFPADYANVLDKDAQFMTGALKNWQSRIKVLKLQAAAGWKPRFQAMLDQAHSICIEEISYPEKEAVRTKKMRCMACGRWEKRCKYGLNAVGTFLADDFNCKGASQVMPAWEKFRRHYEELLEGPPVSGRLLSDDMGLYAIGETCMRKAQVYYQLNTLLLNEVFEAYYKAKGGDLLGNEWVHASENQAKVFLERFQYLQACTADEKRSVPSWGTDKVLWEKVEQVRCDAAQGNDDLMGKLLRKRAESFVGECESEDSGSDAEPEITRYSGTRKRAPVLEESEEESDSESESDGLDEFIVEDGEEEEEPAKPAKPAKPSKPSKPPKPPKPPKPSSKLVHKSARHAGVRKSRRVMGHSPEPAEPACGPVEELGGPVEELGDPVEEPVDPVEEPGKPSVRPSRAPPVDPFRVAQARRAPQGRLPARRECLLQLGELQLQLIREGRDGDASVCTSAIMTLQELMTRVEQLAHTA